MSSKYNLKAIMRVSEIRSVMKDAYPGSASLTTIMRKTKYAKSEVRKALNHMLKNHEVKKVGDSFSYNQCERFNPELDRENIYGRDEWE